MRVPGRILNWLFQVIVLNFWEETSKVFPPIIEEGFSTLWEANDSPRVSAAKKDWERTTVARMEIKFFIIRYFFVGLN